MAFSVEPNTKGSHPSRGAWIEIDMPLLDYHDESRTPHGVRGLKCYEFDGIFNLLGRTPHGVRGLK